MDSTQICCSELELSQSQLARTHTEVARPKYIFQQFPREFDGNERQTEDVSTNWVPRFGEDAEEPWVGTKRSSWHRGMHQHRSAVWCLWGERGSPCAHLGFIGGTAAPAACASLPLCSCLPVVCADCYECHHLVCHVDIIIFS